MNPRWRELLAKLRNDAGPPAETSDTLLHLAETAEEIVRLLDGGGRVDTPGWMGATPLHGAAERGNAEVALALIRRGAPVNARRPDRQDSPLHFAANAEVARTLIDHGAEVEMRDWHGRTPLHWSAQFGRADVAALLLEAGAAAGCQDSAGATPLHVAAQEGHVEIIRRLLHAGAAVDSLDHQGRTPLHKAAWRNQAGAVTTLLEAGADPNTRNQSGQTPAHEARSNHHRTVASLLKAAQARSSPADPAAAKIPDVRSSCLTKIRAHPSRREAITVADHAIFHRWSLGEPPRPVAGLQAGYPWFADIAVDPLGEVIAVATTGATIEFRRWDDLEVTATLRCPLDNSPDLRALDLSPDGRWLAVADARERVHLIDRATGGVVATVDGGERTYRLRFDPTSSRLAAACSFQGGGDVRIDRIESGRLVPLAELDRCDFRSSRGTFVDTLADLAFSPDGKSLALFETSAVGHAHRPEGWRGDVVMYETERWTQRWQASVDASATGDRRPLPEVGHGMGYFTEVLFVDDQTLACGASSGCLLFYRVADGTLTRSVRIHPDAPVVSMTLDPSDRTLWAALGGQGGGLVSLPADP